MAPVSRLPLARKAKVSIRNAKTGLVVFKPDPGKPFSYEELAASY